MKMNIKDAIQRKMWNQKIEKDVDDDQWTICLNTQYTEFLFLFWQ